MKPGTLRSPLPWLGGLIALYLVVPLVAFAVRFLAAPRRGLHVPGLFPSLSVSLEGATIALTLTVLFGVPLAYLLARSDRRLVSAIGFVVLLPLALPPLMSGILLIYLVGPYTTLGRLFGGRLTNSLTGIVLAMTFCAAPFLIVAARSAFGAIDGATLDMAAVLGHSELSRFWRVALPLAMPGVRAGMVLTWLRAFGEYGAVIVLGYHPYSLPVFTYNQFSGAGLPTTLAPTALALAVAIVVIMLGRARPKRRVRTVALPDPDPPVALSAGPLSFEIDCRVGSFHLALSHASAANHLAVLGPSGSGKSTLLRGLVGLNGPGAATLSYDGRAAQGVTGTSRPVGYVAQGFALFPHLTVWQQLLFGRDATPGRAAYWLEHLHLDGLENRFPSEISGGQRQRVALAQALCRSPELLLLDEPFSGLDAPVRHELRRALRRLQHETGLATVIVTHEPEEAGLLAEEVIVLSQGMALQAGTIREVFSRPASPQVARLVGVDNLQRGVVQSEGLITAAGAEIAAPTGDLARGAPVLWSIRPERVILLDSGGLAGTLVDIADVGTGIDLFAAIAPELELRVRTTHGRDFEVGDPCHLALPSDAVSVWPADHAVSGQRATQSRHSSL